MRSNIFIKVFLVLFFAVVSISASANEIELHKGWNLISMQQNDFSKLDKSIKLLWGYKSNQWYAYSNDSNIKSKITNLSIPQLNETNSSEGIWVLSDKDMNITIEESGLVKKYSINKGWNLLGTDKTIKASLFDNSCVYYLWQYDATNRQWKLYRSDGIYIYFGFDKFTDIKANSGFWAYGNSECGVSGELNDTIVGPIGGEITLPAGESAAIPAGSTTGTTLIGFRADSLSAEVGEEMQSYLFSSDHELESVNFSIPVTLPNITSSDDLHAVYIREDGAMKTLKVAYDSNSKRATFSLANNWTFAPLLPAGGSLNASLGTSSGKKSYILLMKKKAAVSSSAKSKLIQMPYYEQPGGTCWATSSKMLTHGLSAASKAHLETKNIYELMGALQIGINDGFNAFYKAASLAKVLGVNYGNYFLWSSIRNKMLKELDKGHPLIYSGTFMSTDAKPEKITHVVLIIGYEYDAKGNLVFVMHDPRNSGGKTMYTKIAWKDMQLDKWLPTEAVTLFWSDTVPSSSNSKLTLGIPTNGNFKSDIYFQGQGKKISGFKAVRYYLQFSPSVSKGYIWSTQQVDPSPETTFRENVNELIMKMPVYNSGSTPDSASVSVEVYEKAHPENKVQASQSVSVDSHDEEHVSFDLNLDDLVKNLGEDISECALSIKLSENGVVSTWDIFDGFKLKKKKKLLSTVYGFALLLGNFKQFTINTTYLSGETKTEDAGLLYNNFSMGDSQNFKNYKGSVDGNTISIHSSESNTDEYGKATRVTTRTREYHIIVDDIKNPKMIQQVSYSGTYTSKYSYPVTWTNTEKKEEMTGKAEETIVWNDNGNANNIPFKDTAIYDKQDYIFELDGKNACSHINSVKGTEKRTTVYPAGYIKFGDGHSEVERTEIGSGFVCSSNLLIEVEVALSYK